MLKKILTLKIICPLVITFLLISLISYWMTFRKIEDSLLASKINEYAHILSKDVWIFNRVGTQIILDTLIHANSLASAEIFLSNGRLFAKSVDSEIEQQESPFVYYFELINERVIKSDPIEYQGEKLGYLRVTCFKYDKLRYVISTLIAAFLIYFLLFVNNLAESKKLLQKQIKNADSKIYDLESSNLFLRDQIKKVDKAKLELDITTQRLEGFALQAFKELILPISSVVEELETQLSRLAQFNVSPSIESIEYATNVLKQALHFIENPENPGRSDMSFLKRLAEKKQTNTNSSTQNKNASPITFSNHTLLSAVNSLRLLTDMIENGYRFDDNLGPANMSSMRKAADTLQQFVEQYAHSNS